MPFELRFVVVILAAFAVAVGVGLTLVPAAARPAHRLAAGARADALFLARILPLLLGAFAAGAAGASSLAFEQRGLEAIGFVLPALAVAGAAWLAWSAARVIRLALVTRRTVSAWLDGAERTPVPGLAADAFVIDVPFPVVAVVGLVRPKLVVARSVLQACSPQELSAIAAHEQHHVERHDNLRRALLASVPDVFACCTGAGGLLEEWREASEDAADDAVGRLGAEGRPLLAQALIRVARLAPSQGWSGPLPASALYRGEGLDRRVRRLLTAAPQAGRRAMRGPVALLVITGGTAVANLDRVHALVELAVTHLP